jgi:hypothetical protein
MVFGLRQQGTIFVAGFAPGGAQNRQQQRSTVLVKAKTPTA